MSEEITIVQIPETPGAGRLGRNVNHDPRSLSYLVETEGVTIASVTWAREIPILDQGSLGSCTGNATVGALGTLPLNTELPTPAPTLDEAEAVTIYSAAEKIDGGAGYPPEDNGSSGLSVAKVAKNAGLISGYQHATSLNAALAALMSGPVITGVNWYDGFDSPDANGLVAISGSVRGGHEFVVRGVDVDAQLVHADNSWGESWGNKGSFSFSWDTWTRLLSEQGDVTVFVPLSSPAPVPTPTPVPPTPDPAPTPPEPPTPTPGPTPQPPDVNDELAGILLHLIQHHWAHQSEAFISVYKNWLTVNGYEV